MQELALSLLLTLAELRDRESLRFEYSMEQGYDSSCGLSALVCFLELYWNEPADEIALASEYLAGKLAIGDFTVSFADMKRILEGRGFRVAAYRMDFAQLEKAAAKYAPIIVHYGEPEGHFALVLEVRDGRIVTADPAQGTIERDRSGFESKWSGAVLLAAKPGARLAEGTMREAVAAAGGRRALAEVATVQGMAGRSPW